MNYCVIAHSNRTKLHLFREEWKKKCSEKSKIFFSEQLNNGKNATWFLFKYLEWNNKKKKKNHTFLNGQIFIITGINIVGGKAKINGWMFHLEEM